MMMTVAGLLVALLLTGCDSKKSEASAVGDTASDSIVVSGESPEQVQGDDDEGEPPIKRNPDDMPTNARKLATWLCVPYIEEDCVPRMGVTYKDTETGYFKYRFYITGGKAAIEREQNQTRLNSAEREQARQNVKDGSDFGQAQLHIHLRSRGLVTQILKPLGHGIYQLNREDTGEVDGWMFTDHDGQRIIVVNATDETEYTIVDEELEADDDTTPAPKFKVNKKD